MVELFCTLYWNSLRASTDVLCLWKSLDETGIFHHSHRSRCIGISIKMYCCDHHKALQWILTASGELEKIQGLHWNLVQRTHNVLSLCRLSPNNCRSHRCVLVTHTQLLMKYRRHFDYLWRVSVTNLYGHIQISLWCNWLFWHLRCGVMCGYHFHYT